MSALASSGTKLYNYRKSLIEVNRSFSSMEPLMLRTKYLSLNAEIASSHVGDAGKPFGIVVRELAYMGEKLSELIEGVESEFSKVVDAVAKWISVERRLGLYLRAYRLSNEGIENEEIMIKDSLDNLALYDDRTSDAWNEALKKFNAGSAQYSVLNNAIKCRDEIVGHMKTTMALTERLSSLIDKVNMVAVRQSHFVAVTALIESAQVLDKRGQIKTIAKEIQVLSREIHSVESSAKDKIISAATLASSILSHIR